MYHLFNSKCKNEKKICVHRTYSHTGNNVYYGTDNFHCNSTNIVNKYFVELKITYICCVFQQHDDTSLDMKLYGFLLNNCDRRKLK